MPVPWRIAAPAALATIAYANARFKLVEDLSIVGSLVHFAIKGKIYDRRRQANYFYRLEEWAQTEGDRVFLWYEGQKWTFKEAYELALKYGTWLKTKYAVAPEEIVGIVAMNSPKMVFMMLGIWAIGASPALINYNLTNKPLLHCIKVSGSRLVFVDDEVIGNFNEEVRQSLAASDFREGGKGPVDLVMVDAAVEREIALSPGVREPDSAREKAGISDGNKMAVLIYTSGTTGMPKAAVVPWSKAYAGASFNKYWMGVKKSDVYYTCMPLYHGTAFILALVPSLTLGYTLSLGHRFSHKTFWRDVRSSGATIIQYVGETCRYLLAAPPLLDPVTGANLDKDNQVRIAFGNGLRPDVWERFKTRFDIPTIGEFYSATEGAGAMWNLARNPYYSGAIGHGGVIAKGMARLAKRDAAIVHLDESGDEPLRDPTNNDFCILTDTNVPGELLYRLDPADIENNFMGYYGNKTATDKKIIRDVFAVGDAWFRTGDTIRIDADNRAYFVDRIGDTFRWRSENVSTAEVSEVLGLHPAISEANVYGVELPHHDGRAGCAAITLHGGVEPTPELMRDIAAHAQRGLPKFAVPVFVRVMKTLEATGNNKQQKQGLRAEGADPGKMGVGVGERVFWLKGGTYEGYGVGEWEGIRRGEVRL